MGVSVIVLITAEYMINALLHCINKNIISFNDNDYKKCIHLELA